MRFLCNLLQFCHALGVSTFKGRKMHVFGVFTFDSSEGSLCKYSYLVLEEESLFFFHVRLLLHFDSRPLNSLLHCRCVFFFFFLVLVHHLLRS